MFVIDFEQVNVPQRRVQCHYNTAFKCSKSTIKTLGKKAKYVQGEIIQKKILRGEVFRGNCPGRNSLRDNCTGGNFMGGNCPGGSCPVRNVQIPL